MTPPSSWPAPGPGNQVSFSGNASIAEAGTVTLSIGSGSTFSAADLTIGAQGVGTVSVSDTGSLLDANETLSLGASQAGTAASGLGLLNVTGGGSVYATAMSLANGATVVLDDTSLLTIVDSGQPSGTVAGAVNNAGTIAMDVAGAAAELDAPLLNTGTVLLNQGTLSLDAGVLDITTAGRIGAPGGGTVTNTRVVMADAGIGEADIDATLHSTGIIQVLSGTFGLNGGGDACSVSVAASATPQFGPPAGGAFTFHMAVRNAGTVAVTAGTLTLLEGAAGAGAFVLDGSATADFVQDPGDGSSLTFLHQGSTLEVQQAAPFGATLSGFGGTDVLDVTPVSFAASVATFAGGTLTVTVGTHSAAFQLVGAYAQAGFHLVNDGHGGTAIGYR